LKRHLAEPLNKIRGFRLLATPLHILYAAFQLAYATHHEEWRRHKGVQKLAKIDASIAEDANRLDKVQMMIKKEVYAALFDGSTPPQAKARAIQYTVNERTNYEFAEEAHAFSHALASMTEAPYVISGVEFLVRYASEMNHEQIGDFATLAEAERGKWVYSHIDERDGKNWDANIQVPHKTALYEIYDALDPRFGAFARRGLEVKGSYKRRNVCIKYRVRGTVKSGHFDTSSGNGFLNREISIQAILALPAHHRPSAVRALVFGDDYLAWHYFNQEVGVEEFMLELNRAERALGIEPERGIFADIRHASFISLTIYIAVDGRCVALPKIGRLLARLMWTTKPLQGRDPKALASGIAQSFWPLYRTYPPLRDFLKHHMQVAPSGDYVGPFYQWLEHCMTRLPAPINWAENHMEKYGPIESMLDMPTLLSGPQTAALVNDPIVNMMYRIDVSDPGDRMATGLRRMQTLWRPGN
jgi:hypothetical protein